MPQDAEILFERRGALGLVTLNRPKALNALTHAMCVALHAQLEAWTRDPAIATVAIRGAGERAFCAGGDIRALYESGRAGTPYALTFYRDEYRLNAAIKHFPKPYVALLRGIAMGGGVGVSVHGTYRVVGDDALFAMPETGIGLFPDVGGSYFLPRCPGEVGLYLALTGARVSAADMRYAGFATHRVPVSRFDALVQALAAGARPEEVIGASAEALPPSALAAHRSEIDRIFGGNSVEEIVAAVEADISPWALAAAASIRTKSPTSLKIAFRQLRRGRHLGFDDCMRMEFRMVSRIVAGRDFYEGVRAAIIDKDNAPKWEPPTLEEVTVDEVDRYFEPLGDEELVL